MGPLHPPGPYQASAQLANPQSWNRYSYVENDPVNWIDPRGLDKVGIIEITWRPFDSGPALYYAAMSMTGGGLTDSVALTADPVSGHDTGLSPWTLFNMSMTAMMTMAIDGLSDGCRGFLFGDKGFSMAAFRTAAANIRYWDMRDPQIANCGVQTFWAVEEPVCRVHLQTSHDWVTSSLIGGRLVLLLPSSLTLTATSPPMLSCPRCFGHFRIEGRWFPGLPRISSLRWFMRPCLFF
jgi:hypothetical protein